MIINSNIENVYGLNKKNIIKYSVLIGMSIQPYFKKHNIRLNYKQFDIEIDENNDIILVLNKAGEFNVKTNLKNNDMYLIDLKISLQECLTEFFKTRKIL